MTHPDRNNFVPQHNLLAAQTLRALGVSATKENLAIVETAFGVLTPNDSRAVDGVLKDPFVLAHTLLLHCHDKHDRVVLPAFPGKSGIKIRAWRKMFNALRHDLDTTLVALKKMSVDQEERWLVDFFKHRLRVVLRAHQEAHAAAKSQIQFYRQQSRAGLLPDL